MKKHLLILFNILFYHANAQQIETWLTKNDQSILFEKQKNLIQFETKNNPLPCIFVDNQQRFQSMSGFGFTLTGGSAMLIQKLPEKQKGTLLKELFDFSDNNIGISFLRISVGASDLDDHVFSYNDLKDGERDLSLSKFSLEKDKKYLIPLLKDILKINPKIQILASPWSPPTWMKDNKQSKGGSLKTEFYQVYAQYLAKYIQEMKKEGIIIHSLTIQNEPLHPGNNPSLYMSANDQALFIKNNLGPLFQKLKINTKIIVYDHNADRPDYPISILNDPQARKFIDGSAFHLYGGSVENIRQVHEAHPDKNVYFTEQWIGAPSNFGGDFNWHIKNLLIGASRNWCKTVLEWNLAADANQNPHTEGGCTACLGALTISDSNISRNAAYYIIAHASKFVRPGSVRIASNNTLGLSSVAFHTPGGKTILIVQNEDNKEQVFNISHLGKFANTQLPAGAVATYIW